MPISVSDRGSNKQELIVHAAEVLGKSPRRLKVFKAVYSDKRKIKTVKDIMIKTGMSHKAVLEGGKILATQDIVEQIRDKNGTGYRKIDFFQVHRNHILRLTSHPDERIKVQTKRHNSHQDSTQKIDIRLKIPAKKSITHFITIDDIDSFSKVKKVGHEFAYTNISERKFKNGIAKILGENQGIFNDWGGESRDLASTRIVINKKRRSAAAAFKGPGTKGKLTPGKMGKNGDQIQRLFKCPADVFLIQYWGQIDDSVLEQIENFSKLKSYLEGREIWYGIIDGIDSTRLIEAYKDKFKAS